jgi:hypothetical protein
MISELHETLVDEIRFSLDSSCNEFGYDLRSNVGLLQKQLLQMLLQVSLGWA